MARMRSYRLVFVVLASFSLATTGIAEARGVRSAQLGTTAPNIYVDVHVTLTDAKTTVTPGSAPRGADARFIVVNDGTVPHSFTIGATTRGVGKQTGFSRVVQPGQHLVLLVYLDYRGVMKYYSGTGKSLHDPTYTGSFTVGPQCSLCIQDN